jgi:hypothetical protein
VSSGLVSEAPLAGAADRFVDRLDEPLIAD